MIFYFNHFSLIIFYHSVWLGFELFGLRVQVCSQLVQFTLAPKGYDNYHCHNKPQTVNRAGVWMTPCPEQMGWEFGRFWKRFSWVPTMVLRNWGPTMVLRSWVPTMVLRSWGLTMVLRSWVPTMLLRSWGLTMELRSWSPTMQLRIWGWTMQADNWVCHRGIENWVFYRCGGVKFFGSRPAKMNWDLKHHQMCRTSGVVLA